MKKDGLEIFKYVNSSRVEEEIKIQKIIIKKIKYIRFDKKC